MTQICVRTGPLHRIKYLDCVAVSRLSLFESVQKLQAVSPEVLVTSQLLVAVGFGYIDDLTNRPDGKGQRGMCVSAFRKSFQTAKNATYCVVCTGMRKQRCRAVCGRVDVDTVSHRNSCHDGVRECQAPVHVVGITVKELVPKVNGLFRVYRGDGKAAIPMINFFPGPGHRPARRTVKKAPPDDFIPIAIQYKLYGIATTWKSGFVQHNRIAPGRLESKLRRGVYAHARSYSYLDVR